MDEEQAEGVGRLESDAVMELSKVASQLLAKFSVGRLYDPIHAKRMNKVENRNRLRDAKTDIEIAKIKAGARMVDEQTNIDRIVNLAALLVPSTAKPDEISQEWINHVQDKTKVVGDEDTRTLWAKIISGEAESPGRFSIRVLDELSRLTKDEAIAFTKAGGFVWLWNGDLQEPLLISDEHHDLWLPHGPLARTNLIENQALYIGKEHMDKTLVLTYYGKKCELRLKREVLFPKPRLTHIGRALFPICGGEPISNEFEKRIKQWSSSGTFEIVKALS